MPTELEELVEFLHHGNKDIRQIATENLVGYSTAQSSLFKRNELEPIRDLKLLIKDYTPIAAHALTILINLSTDAEVLEALAGDDAFLESLLSRILSSTDVNADAQCMLLANLSKSPSITKLSTLSRVPVASLSASKLAIDQLLDAFVKGSAGSYNKNANYDYLSYLFSDLAKFPAGRKHFLTPRKSDADVVPISKIMVFTEHSSTIRRRGVANTLKNSAFSTSDHAALLSEPEIHLLPYILLPLMGSESYSSEDSDGMLDECQLLDHDKKREPQVDILVTHLETLLLLTTTREGRDRLREVKVYPIVRELHEAVEDEGVREGCDRLVQVLMRDEEGEGTEEGKGDDQRIEEVDEEEEMIEVL
ncbi:hypothetical protein B0A48_12817 [Cryoendolithus antarcticus]|uniref:Protein HGH1 homolog n=1 Tax=Cryoendolithus antarcticus TaxID=1507870 RepID=A0A1V8SQF3_9PEZI|nr:hypothetical protein B0A48_12817 [Cryoendolithus antarcticus]